METSADSVDDKGIVNDLWDPYIVLSFLRHDSNVDGNVIPSG